MARDRFSKQPSHYPPLPFHLLRLAQLASTIIVSSVLIFFCHHLHREGIYVPWTFIVLLVVSLLTFVAFLVTSVFYTFRNLSSKYNLYSNGALTLLWVLGLSLLTWNLSWTLGHHCARATWKNEAGIMVCRLYKALTAFTVTALLTTAVLTLLDLRTHRATTFSGAYNPMLDIKAPIERSASPFPNTPNPADHFDADIGVQRHIPYSSDSFGNTAGITSYGNGGGANITPEADEFISPRGQFSRENSDYSGGDTKYRVQKPIEASEFGYAAPSEQTRYGGAGGEQYF